jgi:hypothetical protein
VIVDPVTSSALAAGLVGEPGLAPELVHICRRESHCRWVGAHPQDAWAGGLMQRKALRVGWLDRACRHHRGAPERYSTRGAHGLSAAYSLRFLGACMPPEVLDIPLVSALAAARRAKRQCRAQGACTPASRHRLWVGARRYDRRTRVSSRRPSAAR